MLMAQVRDGDDAAFADLYHFTHALIRGVVERTLRAPEHAAEVLQEVFLYAWDHALSYDPERGTVVGWLTMLARRRAIDRIRTVTRSAARDHRTSLDPNNAVVPDVAEMGIAHLEAARLRAAVRQLGATQREAVALTYFDGYTHQEAATLLRVPLGTLKTRIRAGVAALRDQLGVLPA